MRSSLKTQALSRATISALVGLNFPRQAMFVKQANIAQGPQQVNNGLPVGIAHTGKTETSQNELLGGDLSAMVHSGGAAQVASLKRAEQPLHTGRQIE